MASVNELNLDWIGEAAHQQKINALNASKETFYICNVKAQKAKKQIYANLKINGTSNYLHTRVDTVADVNLLPATVYTQICEDSLAYLCIMTVLYKLLEHAPYLWCPQSMVTYMKQSFMWQTTVVVFYSVVRTHYTCDSSSHNLYFPNLHHTMCT